MTFAGRCHLVIGPHAVLEMPLRVLQRALLNSRPGEKAVCHNVSYLSQKHLDIEWFVKHRRCS